MTFSFVSCASITAKACGVEPELRRKLSTQDIIVGYQDPEAFREVGQRTFDQWKEIAESLGLYVTA